MAVLVEQQDVVINNVERTAETVADDTGKAYVPTLSLYNGYTVPDEILQFGKY